MGQEHNLCYIFGIIINQSGMVYLYLMLQWKVDLMFIHLQGDLNTEGDRLMVAKGGFGGSMHSAFQPSKGQVRNIRLDLKLIADLGLVGWEWKHTWTRWLISVEAEIFL